MFNIENSRFFNNPNEADNWIWRMEHGVSDWINKQGKRGTGDKSYYKLVFWVSQTYLKVLKDDVSLPEFVQLLIEECPNAFRKEETKDTLFHSIEKFEFTRHLNKFDEQPESSIIRIKVREVEELLTKEIAKPSETVPTLEQRMLEFAQNAIATSSYDKVCVKPTYNGKKVSLSVEKYISQKFRDEERPSYVVIFECVEEVVTENTVNMLYGKFCNLSSIPNKKLYIASTHTYTRNTQDEASLHSMGLVLVNLDHKVDEKCFILPRSSEYKNYLYWRQMLSGEKSMTLPIIACDGPFLFYSLKDILKSNNITVSREQENKAPYLTNAEIEDVAMNLIKPQVDFYVRILQQWRYNEHIPDCIINPYILAESMGLRIESGFTGGNISHIDIENKTITIGETLGFNYHCARFGLSHEIGHYIFHGDMILIAKKRQQVIKPQERYWMEHHANYFASCLLMPSPIVCMLYHICYCQEANGSVSMPLMVNGGHYPEFAQRVIGKLAYKMCVSFQAMAIRLEKLGLIKKEPFFPQFVPTREP